MLIEENKLITVFVPSNCTDLLQPLDLSVNKAVKEHMCQQFCSWYSEQVKEKLEAGEDIENGIAVDMHMSTIKEVGARWLVSACDHVCCNTQIVVNGFKKAGIADAITDPDSISTTTENIDVVEDPFEDCDLDES